MRSIIKSSLGGEIEDFFQSFEKEPEASASLAQVHRATLLDGQEVAVKIKYPRVKNFINVDLKIHDFISNLYARKKRDFNINPTTRKQIYKNLKSELNFLNEAKNAIRCKENLKSENIYVYVPYIYENLCATNILTMEYIDGIKINDVDAIERNGWNKTEIADTIIRTMSNQIFKYGFVHADPHPGNIFLRESRLDKHHFEVVLLDHGLYADVDDDLRLKFAEFWVSIVNEDGEKLEQICNDWGIAHPDLFANLMSLQSYDGVNLDCLLLQDIVGQSGSDDGDGGKNPATYVIEESLLSSVRNHLFLFIFKYLYLFT